MGPRSCAPRCWRSRRRRRRRASPGRTPSGRTRSRRRRRRTTRSRWSFEGDTVRHGKLLAAVGCAAMVFAGVARAAEDTAAKKDPALEEARQHAAKAKVHYDLGEFEKAAEEYILVYRLKPLPALLYNIAQSYRQAGQYEKAKQFYRSYLRESKDISASNRSAIEKAIREIEELQAKEKRAKEGPPKGIAQTPAVTGGSLALTPPPPLPPTAAQTPERAAVNESLRPPASTSTAA